LSQGRRTVNEPEPASFDWTANPNYDSVCNPFVVPNCDQRPALPDASTVKFYHGDHLGTTRFMTDATGAAIESSVYSAFGMRVSGTNHRYGYDGAWGYQSHRIDEVPFGMDPDTAFPFLHVGHRYYDPSTGRFLQRDPIGVGDGPNVYLYVSANPLIFVDPSGLQVAEPIPPYYGAGGAGAAKEAAETLAMLCAVGYGGKKIGDSLDPDRFDRKRPNKLPRIRPGKRPPKSSGHTEYFPLLTVLFACITYLLATVLQRARRGLRRRFEYHRS
jgi:RHS repeat-associated protein